MELQRARSIPYCVCRRAVLRFFAVNDIAPTARAPVLIALCWIATQWTLPLARVHIDRAPPFPARYAWSMFAGPLTARCEHTLTYALRDGTPQPLPLPRSDAPSWAILTARTRDEFSVASHDLIAYADTDAEISRALDDFLSRYARSIDPSRTHRLTSVLRCDSPGAPTFSRTATFAP